MCERLEDSPLCLDLVRSDRQVQCRCSRACIDIRAGAAVGLFCARLGPAHAIAAGPAPAESALERFELSPFCFFLHRACAMTDDLVEDGGPRRMMHAYAADVFWGSKDDRANALVAAD